MYIFNRLAGYPDSRLKRTKVPPVSLARKVYNRPSKADLMLALPKSTSFLIARHPFDRFVSAYRDKIANAYKVTKN